MCVRWVGGFGSERPDVFVPLKRSCAGMHTIIDLVGDEKKSKI